MVVRPFGPDEVEVATTIGAVKAAEGDLDSSLAAQLTPIQRAYCRSN